MLGLGLGKGWVKVRVRVRGMGQKGLGLGHFDMLRVRDCGTPPIFNHMTCQSCGLCLQVFTFLS